MPLVARDLSFPQNECSWIALAEQTLRNRLELQTLQDRACSAIDPPTARAIVGYRASSSILVIDDSDLSELIDPLENSISICLLVHNFFELRN